jgi:K+-transporting ATPase KdpC subunit
MKRENGNVRENEPRSVQPVRRGFLAEALVELRVSIIATIVLTVIVSALYPVVVWGLSQVLFDAKANGSLIGRDGKPATKEEEAVGSSLIGQGFSDAKYFHPRPSAAGSGYDPTASGGSNLGPTSAKLMYGTTKNIAFTVFAVGKAGTAVEPVAGRVQGLVVELGKTTISIAPAASGAKTAYALDATVADPNAVVNYHGRTIHATTIPTGSIVELKLNDNTPPAVTAINVVDQEIDGGVSAVDTSGNKITLNDSGGTVVNLDPKNTVLVVNGKPGAKLSDITTDMTVHIVSSTQMDNDGIADRVIRYCQDNKISYKSSIADSVFTDADGVDDVRLINAFNSATMPTIMPDPKTPIPADAVTASGSGLDPHISVENGRLQAGRVAAARKISVAAVNKLIDQFTEGPSLGFLGDAGVNVLRINLALDQITPANPTTMPESKQ